MLLPQRTPSLMITRRAGFADVAAAAQKILVCAATRVELHALRRCGKMADATDLKSVLAKSEVWVRIPSSAPLKTHFTMGSSRTQRVQSILHVCVSKRTDYSFICQVPPSAIPASTRLRFMAYITISAGITKHWKSYQ